MTIRPPSQTCLAFLSIQAQDFIEDGSGIAVFGFSVSIPEHSSSGLH